MTRPSRPCWRHGIEKHFLLNHSSRADRQHGRDARCHGNAVVRCVSKWSPAREMKSALRWRRCARRVPSVGPRTMRAVAQASARSSRVVEDADGGEIAVDRTAGVGVEFVAVAMAM